MKRFFMKYGFAVLATATVVAVALSLMTFLSNHINVLENAAGTVAAPFRSAAAFVADWIDDQLRYVEDFDELRRENKELRRQIAEMEEQLRQAQEDSEENQRLRFQMRGQGPANANAAASPEVQASPAIAALLAQSEFSQLQRVGGKFWDPVTEFAGSMAAGNPSGASLQSQLDRMVEGVTAR